MYWNARLSITHRSPHLCTYWKRLNRIQTVYTVHCANKIHVQTYTRTQKVLAVIWQTGFVSRTKQVFRVCSCMHMLAVGIFSVCLCKCVFRSGNDHSMQKLTTWDQSKVLYFLLLQMEIQIFEIKCEFEKKS